MARVRQDRWYLAKILNHNKGLRVYYANAVERSRGAKLVKLSAGVVVANRLRQLESTYSRATEFAERWEREYIFPYAHLDSDEQPGQLIGNICYSNNKKALYNQQINAKISYDNIEFELQWAKNDEKLGKNLRRTTRNLDKAYTLIEQYTRRRTQREIDTPQRVLRFIRLNRERIDEKYTRILNRSCRKIANRPRDLIIDVDVESEIERYRNLSGVVAIWHYEELLRVIQTTNIALELERHYSIVQKYHCENDRNGEYRTVYMIWHEPEEMRRYETTEILRAEKPLFDSFARFLPER
jgi:hypothetical protein